MKKIMSAYLMWTILVSSVVAGEKSKISQSDMEIIYKLISLEKRQDGYIAQECENEKVDPIVEMVDLNRDGVNEVFVLVNSNTGCYGFAGGNLILLVKDKKGQYNKNFDFSAGGYKILKTRNKGFPDIEIGGPGFCFPVWRWNGDKYEYYKKICENEKAI